MHEDLRNHERPTQKSPFESSEALRECFADIPEINGDDLDMLVALWEMSREITSTSSNGPLGDGDGFANAEVTA